jgi:DNA-binding MarR family transcriptional regulator
MADDVLAEMVQGCMLSRARLISRVLTNIYDEHYAQFGITSPQLALMTAIRYHEPANRSKIARFTQQDRSTLSRNVQLLIDAGWIEECDPESGGRSRPIILTPLGRKLMLDIAPAWRAAQAKAKEVLGMSAVSAVMEVGDDLLFRTNP